MISYSTLEVYWGRKKNSMTKERTNRRMDERTDGVTLSLLELLIAAKICTPKVQKLLLIPECSLHMIHNFSAIYLVVYVYK